MSTVSFPGLGIGPFTLDSVAFTLPIGDGIDIMWYALIITVGFLVAFGYAYFRARKNERYVMDDLLDIMILLIIFGVIGARLYYVVMSPNEFDSFFDVINIRSGGLAIYGGLIGGVCAIFLMCRIKKMNVWRILDMAAPGVMIAQAIGRWGNFVNVEAYGSVTTLPWRMSSPGIASTLLRKGLIDAEGYAAILDGTLGVHPTFLYESLWNLIGFVLLNLVYRKKKYNGQILLCYLVWYGFGRMWIEGLRTDSLYLGSTGIRVSQLLSFLILTLGLALMILLWIRGRNGQDITDVCRFCTADAKRKPIGVIETDGKTDETVEAIKPTEDGLTSDSDETEDIKQSEIQTENTAEAEEREKNNDRTE